MVAGKWEKYITSDGRSDGSSGGEGVNGNGNGNGNSAGSLDDTGVGGDGGGGGNGGVDDDPIADTVDLLRQQRMMMVQGEAQFFFLYEVLRELWPLRKNP